MEPIHFNEDGTIDEVKMTSIGAGEPFAMNEAIQGWRACEVAGGAYVSDYDLVMKSVPWYTSIEGCRWANKDHGRIIIDRTSVNWMQEVG